MTRPDLIERLALAQAERARQDLLRRLRKVEAVDSVRIDDLLPSAAARSISR